MLTINKILEEVKNVPLHRLEELHQFITTLSPDSEYGEDAYVLSPQEEEAINSGLNCMEKGDVKPHEEALKLYSQWL